MTNTIPTDWSEELLATLLEVIESGSRPKGGVTEWTGTVPSYGGENILMSNGMRFHPVKKISQEFAESMTKGILLNEDVLINKDGANTGKCGFYKQPKGESLATINEHLFLLRGVKTKVKQDYLYHSICSTGVKEQLRLLITGSAQPGLNSKFVEYLKIPVPPLVEQEKIADILTSVDDTIEHTQAQVAKLQDLKTATMNELLTRGIGHTEFRESELGLIPTTWKIKQMHQLCIKIQDGTHFSPSTSGDDYKYVTSKNIRMGYMDLTDCATISAEEHEKIYSRCDVKKRDLLLTKDGANTGNVALNHLEEEFSLLSSVALLRADEEKCKPEFLLQFMMSQHASTQIDLLMSGNAITRLTLEKIKKISACLPPLGEQEKIANILTSLDDQIEAVESKLVQLESLKKSLMGDLLTGRVRVSVD